MTVSDEHLTEADFERRYQTDPDPWSYESSAYERDKYVATLAACGDGPFDSALELGASIGVFSAQLAPRCGSLITVDAALTAVQIARRRLADVAHVQVVLGPIPDAIPDLTFDLVVASEILYYLKPDVLARTLEVVREQLAVGGRLVAVHWRPPGPERPFTAAQVHAQLRELAWLTPVEAAPTPDYLLDVFTRR